jgi:hypothetical protein
MRSQPCDQRYGAEHRSTNSPSSPLKWLMKHRSKKGKPAELSQIEAHSKA